MSSTVVAEFHGGPWDGARRAFSNPVEIAWLGGDRNCSLPSLHRKFLAGTEPYMVESEFRKGSVMVRTYAYVGHAMFHCDGCGVLHARRNADGTEVDHCDLCGEPVAV